MLLDATSLARLRGLFRADRRGRPSSGPHSRAAGGRGELDRTLVVFTADHGEMLGDHWMLGKAGFFPQAFHVPLVIRQPNSERGRRVTAFTEHVDLMPTVLESLGLRVPRQCDGHSLSHFLPGIAALLAGRRTLGA